MKVNVAFHGIEKTRVIKAYNISVYGIDFSSDEANKAMITKTKKTQTLDQRPGPTRLKDSGGKCRRAGPGQSKPSSFNINWLNK